MLPLKVIARPLHQHNAKSAKDYLAKQAAAIQKGRNAHPFLEWRDPAMVASPIAAEVNGGAWIVRCPCGNALSADPEWKLACCWECGAIYQGVGFPAEWEEIERVLVCRQRMNQRNWTTETLDALKQENRDHGDPIPEP